LHHPASPSASTELAREAEVTLPSAYELDQAPAFERFIFITSDAPLNTQAVLAAAHDLAQKPNAMTTPLPLVHSTEQVSVLLKKVP
jgi:hypothetical protein